MRVFGRRRKQLARVDLDGRIVELHGAGTVVDVGANVGQYAKSLRAAGLKLPIISTEPGTNAHGRLIEAAANNLGWTVAPRMAISDTRGTVSLNVNTRSDMNFLKPIAEVTRDAFPKAKPVTTEGVQTERLDEIVGSRSTPIFLKIDT